MYIVLNCHNVAKHTKLHLGWLWFNVTSSGIARCLKKKELYNGIPMSLCGECYENVYT
jgi:hypothetical protein